MAPALSFWLFFVDVSAEFEGVSVVGFAEDVAVVGAAEDVAVVRSAEDVVVLLPDDDPPSAVRLVYASQSELGTASGHEGS